MLPVRQIRQTRILAQVGQHGVDTLNRTCNRAVDSLTGQQDGAFDVMSLTESEQGACRPLKSGRSTNL